MGGGVNDSEVYPGMIFKQDAVTRIRTVKDAKIAVYSCPFDIQVRRSQLNKVPLMYTQPPF